MLTGYEAQLAEYTFGAVAPDNLYVVDVIDKYTKGISGDLIKSNPLVTVIYMSETTGHYGVFHIEKYQNQLERVHETFSFKYQLTEKAKFLRKGTVLRKGERLSHSTNVKPDGYATGISANVIFMSTPYTIEDGFEVSESFMKKATPLATGSRVAEWGKKYYPLNIYPDKNNPGKYKPFPEIGDTIRDDGLVFALRRYDPTLNGLDMTEAALRHIDYKHDKLVFGKPGAKVFDITVHTNTNEGRRSTNTPCGMEDLASLYEKQKGRYYEKILELYERIKRESHGQAVITPEFQTLIEQALGDKPNVTARRLSESKGRKNSIHKTWRADVLDEWRVEVAYVYEFPMDNGSKHSSRHGGKGVICKVRKDSEMPRDDFGNVADAIVYVKAAISRLNPGQFYEHFINACSRDISNDIRALMANKQPEQAWALYLKYLDIAAPETLKLVDKDNLDERDAVLHSICKDGIYLYIPADDENLNINIYTRMMEFRPPNESQVTYTTVEGKVIRTKYPMLIAEMDMIVLDKADFKPMAVSGICRQHHGCVAVENKGTKHSTPFKEQPAKVLGETETRTAAAIMGGEAVADMMDLVNNPAAHREVIRRIYTADNPMQISNVVDRTKIPRGGRPLDFVTHIGECAGWKIIDV
jgi:hypothetical protein